MKWLVAITCRVFGHAIHPVDKLMFAIKHESLNKLKAELHCPRCGQSWRNY